VISDHPVFPVDIVNISLMSGISFLQLEPFPIVRD
jgi:hypothetical protein